MASHLRRTDDLHRLKTRELVLQNTDGSYAPAMSILTVDGSGNVITGVTGAAAPTIYTNTIRPYPPGSTGSCNITGQIILTNEDTVSASSATIIRMLQSDATGGTGGIAMFVVGNNSTGFGSTPNDRNQFATYAYPKPNRAPITKIESTPLMTNTTGPLGLTGAIGDKYIYGNTQIGGYVAAPTAQFEDVSVGSNLGIGVGSAVHALDVNGQVYVSGSMSPLQIFNAPGRYTVRIPANVGTATVTVIGAGGQGSSGGYGGYITGTFDTTAYVGQTLTVQVGGSSYDNTQPASASFVSFLGGGPIIAMAGAGGNGASSGAVFSSGGHGGGGTGNFIAIPGGSVAIGLNGQTLGNAGGGQGGQTGGGGGGGVVYGPYSTPGQPGLGRPGPETYADVRGGGGLIAGANGYTSGGGGAQYLDFSGVLQNGGGGGGSSFVSSAFTITNSLRGDTGAYATTVPAGYGRGGQGGYVSISYVVPPSLYTSGDIVSGAGLRISAPTVPDSATATGTPGQIAWDANYIYVCVGTNTWKRCALSW